MSIKSKNKHPKIIPMTQGTKFQDPQFEQCSKEGIISPKTDAENITPEAKPLIKQANFLLKSFLIKKTTEAPIIVATKVNKHPTIIIKMKFKMVSSE